MTQDLSVTSKRTRALVKCLQNSQYDVVEDLPGHIRDAIRLYAPQARYISPTLVINCLKKQPAFEYSDEDLLYLLDYILENLENLPKPGDLEGLKLLPTCDGQFATFKTHPNTSERVYMETSTCSQNLLPGMCHRFVKRFQEKHFSNLNQALEIMTSSEHWKQLTHVDVDDVIQLLSETLPSSWKQNTQDYVDWTPCNDDHLNPQWLKLFWHFLYREDIDLVKLEGLKLLPVSEVTKEPIRLMSLKRNSRIINVSDADKIFPDFQKIEEVLIKVGITVCELPDFVTKHPQILKSCFVYGIHQDDVMKALKATGVKSIDDACSSRPDTQHLFYSSLLPYLSGSTLSEQDISFLRSLTVFKEFQSKRLRSIDSGVTFLNEDDFQRLPEVPLHKPYVIIGTFEHRLLAEKLDVRLDSFEDALTKILQTADKYLYSRDMIQVLFEWVRLHYGTISSLQGVDNLLKEIPFVPNGNNKLAKAKTMYNQSNKFVRWLVQDNDVLLSEQVSSDCLDILNKLGLRKEDRIEVHQLMKTAKYISTERDVERAEVLLEYFCKYPHCLQNPELCQTLNQISWITCKYDPPHFYPKELPFIGEKGILYTPRDVVVYTREICSLAGASVPMVEGISKEVLDQFCVRKTPYVKEVLEQLRQCVKCNTSKNEMVQQIYEYLNKNIFEHKEEILDGLPEKWILVDDQFVNVESVYREEGKGAIDLRPFLCILPKWYTGYDSLLNVAGVPEQVDGNSSFLVDVLKKIKTCLTESANTASSDLEASLRVSINILRKLVETEDEIEQENIRCKLYIPTNCQPMNLLPPDQVCYDDVSYDKDEDDHLYLDEDEPPIYLVHSDVPSHIAKKFGVVSLTKRLAGADEIGGITQTGQYEPITVRLKNILRDGYQPESIPKEMVQNAEDAGASEVKFLLDLRTNKNAMKKLLDPKMESVHGPALWVYNDAAFTDEDLKNITKLGGATKSDDGSKIGQFRLGFNAVYHITDVPSFVTRNFITFFDPHKSHLERHIKGDGRGIQLNFTANPSRMRRFRDQFLPYESIFGCKILEDEKECTPYNSTLFRFPLRTEAEARKSEIWHESYDEEKMKVLLTSLCRTACQMLLFTENVKLISVYLLRETENCKPSLLYHLNKKTTETGPVENSFREAALCCVYNENPAPLDATSVVTLKEEWSETGKQYLQLNDIQPVTFQTWVVVMSVGRGRTVKLCQEDICLRSGLLPCGGVAWNANSDADGGVFCYLPLSVPHSGLPVCINGSFAVSADRRSLWRKKESGTSDFKANWNESLLNDAVVSAYITLLQGTMAIEHAKKSSDLFLLWPNPLKTSKNSDYGAVMTGFYKAIVCGINDEIPPNIFMKEDGIYKIDDVVFTVDEIQNDRKMFPIVERVFKKIISKEVINPATWVRTGFEQAGYSSKIISITYSWERFFKEVFLPHLTDIQHEDVLNLVSHALGNNEKPVLDLMKFSNCIPSKTVHGRVYKRPSSLLDPYQFKDIFSEDEGVFPEEEFLETLDKRQKGTLKDIGCLNDDLRWEDVLERTRTIQEMWQDNQYGARLRIKALLNFMDKKLKVADSGHQIVQEDLRKVTFLPAVCNENVTLQCPNEIYLAKDRDLVGYVRYILDIKSGSFRLSLQVKQLLGMEGKEVNYAAVLENLNHLKKIHGNGTAPDTLRSQCMSMYSFLQRHIKEVKVQHFLMNEVWFLVDQGFTVARNLSFCSEHFPPYLYKVPKDFGTAFEKLLRAAGVKDYFDFNDFIETLVTIEKNQEGKPLASQMTSSILTKVIKPLYDIAAAGNISIEGISKIPLPDSQNILQASGNLSFCDLDSFQHLIGEYNLCHKEIPLPWAKKLGVRDIREQMLKKYSHRLPGFGGIGERFGQREELVTRITRIMEGYPCDFTILKELVQNADDAKATEVHFVLDDRTHPAQKLFYNSMSELQGPALLAFNNRPFTDDDVIGIQKLGVGNKAEDTDKTGRYGVGFNVVYHLTDCPMFLSGGDTLCIFDPTLQYITDADEVCPGRMFKPIDKKMLSTYKDIFHCFFSFENDFDLREGTLFRFPLRKTKSKISDQVSPSSIVKLFTDFKEEMFEVLLFLKSVTKISFSVCTKGNLDNTYTVTADLSLEHANARTRFFQTMSEFKDKPLLEIPVTNMQYEATIVDNDNRRQEWFVHQRLGVENKDRIPISVISVNSVRKLLPKGGVAARCFALEGSTSKDENKFQGKAYCFLPLPIKTNLPVHVDGYFSLGHEARRNLWEGPPGDPNSDWNRLIAKEIIGPAYVHIIQKMKGIFDRFEHCGLDIYQMHEKLQHYHTLFPLHYTSNVVNIRDIWEEISHAFYDRVIMQKHMLFPVVQPKCKQNGVTHISEVQNGFILMWKSCISQGVEEGFFDDLHHQIRENKKDEGEEPQHSKLRLLLLELGFPLLESPLNLYEIMRTILHTLEDDSVTLLKVNPKDVARFLKTKATNTTLQGLPMKLSKTIVSSTERLKLLTEYTTKTTNVDLSGLPLLLTQDGVLREFSKERKVFHTSYYSLLPKLCENFLHSLLLNLLNRNDECFAEFGVPHLVQGLSTHLPPDVFCKGEYVLWASKSDEKIPTPKREWVEMLWEFLSKKCNTHDLLLHCRDWSILPANADNKKFLVPMNLAKTVLSPQSSKYHESLHRIMTRPHAPILDTMGRRDAFVTQYVSSLSNVEDTLSVFARIVKVHLGNFRVLQREDHECILRYLSNVSNFKNDYSVHRRESLNTIKSLPCFETIYGDFIALVGKTTYSVSMTDIPQDDQNIWITKSGCQFLKKKLFLSDLYEILGVEDVSDRELYRRYILPYYNQFSFRAQWKHIDRIKLMVMNDPNPDGVVTVLNLKHTPLIPIEGEGLYLASRFHDEKNPVFKEMSEEKYFPPKHPWDRNQTSWYKFLCLIGMQKEVSCEQFLQFATEVSKEPNSSKREKILVTYFANHHHLHDLYFLQNLGNVAFISAAKVDNALLELHKQYHAKKVTLCALHERHCNLVWSEVALLPAWVDLRCHFCGSSGIERNLNKNEGVRLRIVLKHTQNLCSFLWSSETLSEKQEHPAVKHEKLLNDILRDIFKFLSERCNTPETCGSYENKGICCGSCEEIVKTLEEIPVVPLKGGELFKAKRLTKHLPTEYTGALSLFIKEVPDHFIVYSKLLYSLGTTKEPTVYQFASILKLIKSQNVESNPNFLTAAQQAIKGFFRCLAHQKNFDPDKIDKLYLLEKKEVNCLHESTKLYYNDIPSYEGRLEDFGHLMMRDLIDLKTNLSMDELLGKLGHLKPCLVSENVEERQQHSAGEVRATTNCDCPTSQQLQRVLSWRVFAHALRIILAHEEVVNLSKHHDDIFETTFTVKCVPEILTELYMKDGTKIPESQQDKGVSFKRTGTHSVDIFLSHNGNKALIENQVSESFNNFFGNFLKQTENLQIVLFKSSSEEQVIRNLIEKGLKVSDYELKFLDKRPVLGSSVEEDIICLLVQDPSCQFFVNEYVAFNDTNGSDEHYIYAKIVQRVGTEAEMRTSRLNLCMAKYLIEVGGNIQKEVSVTWLYKFPPPKDEPFSPDYVDNFNPTSVPSQSNDCQKIVLSNPFRQIPEQKPDDLDAIKKEITEIIQALRHVDLSTRDMILRRLMRKWHPDKHPPERKYFAEEVFKQIQREIENLKNYVPCRPDTCEDTSEWARQNTSQRRRYWNCHRRRFGTTRRQSGRWYGSWHQSSRGHFF